MTPTLLSLAPELVYAIAEGVNKKDLEQLRLTCKHLDDLFESQVLHTIYFSVQSHNYNEATARLQYLATTKDFSRGLARSGRHLHIGPLSPKPFSSLKSYKYIGEELVPIPEPEDGPEVPVVEELMRTYLRVALDALRNLQSVTWFPEEKDAAWTHEIIMDFLISRPSLNNLRAELSHLQVALPLDRMQNLREITFTERYGHRSSDTIRINTYNNLAKLSASCPAGQITKLSVVLTSLHQIFQFRTPEIEPLRLKDLRMTQSFIKLDAFTIPHLRHLTSLQLLSMKNPTNLKTESSDASNDTSSDDLGNAKHHVGSEMSDFWSRLHRERIHLREIAVDNINAGLLVYLTHYTGLTKLAVSTTRFGSVPDSESDSFAKRFFVEPLASHIETLEELAVHSAFEDLWCFGEHNISAFSRCKGLKKLGVSVAKSELPPAKTRVSSGNSEVETDQNQPDIVKTLLDMVSTHMPRLSQLAISPSSEPHFRGGRRQGTRNYMHRKASAQRAIECLLAYSIPPSSAAVQFPRVSIWSKKFDPSFVLSSSDETVRERRYQEIKETRIG